MTFKILPLYYTYLQFLWISYVISVDKQLTKIITQKTVDTVNKISQLSTLISTSFTKAFISVFRLFPHIHTPYYDVY